MSVGCFLPTNMDFMRVEGTGTRCFEGASSVWLVCCDYWLNTRRDTGGQCVTSLHIVFSHVVCTVWVLCCALASVPIRAFFVDRHVTNARTHQFPAHMSERLRFQLFYSQIRSNAKMTSLM